MTILTDDCARQWRYDPDGVTRAVPPTPWTPPKPAEASPPWHRRLFGALFSLLTPLRW